MTNGTDHCRTWEALDQERARFAAMLHDGVAQSLTALAFTTRLLWEDLRVANSGRADEMRAVMADVEECGRQVRAISRVLAPEHLVNRGLGAALAEYSRCLPTRHRERLELPADTRDVVLPRDVAVHCFAVACGLVRHALDATQGRVAVEIAQDAGGFTLRVATAMQGAFPLAADLPGELTARAGAIGAWIGIDAGRACATFFMNAETQ